MPIIQLNRLAAIINGKFLCGQDVAAHVPVKTISIDSRTLADVSSCLFFAIKGVRHDGHDYLEELYRKGVRNFVVSTEDTPLVRYSDACVVFVPDTLEALRQLAATVRHGFHYPVLAITGSNGKTIVKEWLFELLQDELKIIRSPKSFNSQVGVPLSVWNMTENFDLAIFEAGISQPGEMEKLARIILPTVGLITNIGDAHQENFQSQAEKADEKLQLFESCELIIYCKDQELVHQRIHSKFGNEVSLFSWSFTDNSADLLIRAEKEATATTLYFKVNGEGTSVEIPFGDAASIENACHCLAFVLATNRLTEQVKRRFSSLQAVAMRLELKQGVNNCSLINDYYNSDINSLEIALQFLNRQASFGKQPQSLILSDIRQSGFTSGELARVVARLVKLYRVNRLIGIGEELWKHQALFAADAVFFRSTDEFLAHFRPSDFKNEQILLKGAREFRFERIAAFLQKKYHQTQMEINLNALVENLNRYKALLKPETKVMVMVKAFSYGSGTVEIARALEFQQVDYLAVAVADEGIELRQAGIETPIIVMNPEEHSFEMMLEYRLEPNIYSTEVFQQFDAAARRLAVSDYPIHLKIETGMHRLGFSSADELAVIARRVPEEGRLRIRSVFSHLAASDDSMHDAFTRQQYQRFKELSDVVVRTQPNPVIRHLLNSAGIERFADLQLEMVRLGIGLYGVAQSAALQVETVARWTTVVSQVKDVVPGETVGYSRKGRVEQPKKVAIIPVGYADGYDRRLSNGAGKVWVNGHICPVIGNICMDMTMIDVTGLAVHAGDTVELMGGQIRLEELARWMGTIPYEVLTGISQRVHRIYIQE
ncbi:bifunctional UDP-N-acetylmuramoyl-tripeptide:D-alanyl-D-alanine ligase/alanine racemase [Gaoshiqia sediminis]|uniref:Alanine racemase n=1 Tax=Gaoshiqia sediminis TaxID=2986998 RepID=A0AA41YCR7_9BACT|nr:bifunctional UDP-N-acetylmuramoyl-tripeptide:D-alanyl-D-alanine ligase/alanine racemase [Gaoshiqia sediminis]MCW0484193.1 bifunctional UDP-N-acetylmuramoyl-tripeptide:D-alanyl-D-alanine ligase/alanine racemase [Gaoshiqia sediminis]